MYLEIEENKVRVIILWINSIKWLQFMSEWHNLGINKIKRMGPWGTSAYRDFRMDECQNHDGFLKFHM